LTKTKQNKRKNTKHNVREQKEWKANNLCRMESKGENEKCNENKTKKECFVCVTVLILYLQAAHI